MILCKIDRVNKVVQSKVHIFIIDMYNTKTAHNVLEQHTIIHISDRNISSMIFKVGSKYKFSIRVVYCSIRAFQGFFIAYCPLIKNVSFLLLTPCPVLIFFIFGVFVLTLVCCSIDL